MKLTIMIQKKWWSVNDEDNEDTLNILLPGSEIVRDAKERKSRGPNRFCESGQWKNGYQNWSDEEFKNHLRQSRQAFEIVISLLTPFTVKQSANKKPTPAPP